MIKRYSDFIGSLNESEEVSMDVDDRGYVKDVKFRLGDNAIGGATISQQYIEGIESEYSDSVDDFDESVFRRFDHNQKIYNLEDFWIDRPYRGRRLARPCLEKLMSMFNGRQMVLRAFPEGGVDEDTLVRLYGDFGFTVLQETESDGTIMGKLAR